MTILLLYLILLAPYPYPIQRSMLLITAIFTNLPTVDILGVSSGDYEYLDSLPWKLVLGDN